MSSARVPAYKLPAFPKGERTASRRTTLVEVVAVFIPLGYWSVALSGTHLIGPLWLTKIVEPTSRPLVSVTLARTT
jgi:hypothetical protein